MGLRNPLRRARRMKGMRVLLKCVEDSRGNFWEQIIYREDDDAGPLQACASARLLRFYR